MDNRTSAVVITLFFSPLKFREENRTSVVVMTIGARRGDTVPYLIPLWPCNKVLKLNFKSIISQTNDCSLRSLNLAKPLLLDIS